MLNNEFVADGSSTTAAVSVCAWSVVTVLSVGAIFENYISQTNISQGSVATSFRCGGICSYHFIANWLLSVQVKQF